MLKMHLVDSLGVLRKWRLERGWDPSHPGRRLSSVDACEHIVVLNKRDLVPEWGMEAGGFSFGNQKSCLTVCALILLALS